MLLVCRISFAILFRLNFSFFSNKILETKPDKWRIVLLLWKLSASIWVASLKFLGVFLHHWFTLSILLWWKKVMSRQLFIIYSGACFVRCYFYLCFSLSMEPFSTSQKYKYKTISILNHCLSYRSCAFW